MKTHAMSAAFLSLALTVAGTSLSFAQSGSGELNPQTEVRLHIVDRIASGMSRVGDRINLRVDADVQDASGNVLIRGGTPAYGTITESKGHGSWGRRGHLNFSVDYTTAVDGQRVPLRGQNGASGRKGGTAAWATAAIVAPVAGFFMTGGNVTLEPGTPVLAFVDTTMTISTMPRAGQPMGAPGMGASAAAITASAPSGPTKVVVLRNGDKITGSVESLANGVYTIVTQLGALQIPASQIATIRDPGSAPVTVVARAHR